MIEKIKEIKARYSVCPVEQLPEFIASIAQDERAGVKSIAVSAQKAYDKYQDELKRLDAMQEYERAYAHLGYICGVDEVGRGPLAGPVVASAVILPKDCQILYINDSKQLSAKKREKLYDEIMEKAVAVGTGLVSHERIDEINILQATYEAMRMAIAKLPVKPDVLCLCCSKKAGCY